MGFWLHFYFMRTNSEVFSIDFATKAFANELFAEMNCARLFFAKERTHLSVTNSIGKEMVRQMTYFERRNIEHYAKTDEY